jgi:hypothetical protein
MIVETEQAGRRSHDMIRCLCHRPTTLVQRQALRQRLVTKPVPEEVRLIVATAAGTRTRHAPVLCLCPRQAAIALQKALRHPGLAKHVEVLLTAETGVGPKNHHHSVIGLCHSAMALRKALWQRRTTKLVDVKLLIIATTDAASRRSLNTVIRRGHRCRSTARHPQLVVQKDIQAPNKFTPTGAGPRNHHVVRSRRVTT